MDQPQKWGQLAFFLGQASWKKPQNMTGRWITPPARTLIQKPTRGALWLLYLDEIVTKLNMDIRSGM